MKAKWSYLLVGLILIAATARLFPFHRIKSNELADNPQGCPYYITLQSILANYSQLSTDKANVEFIKHRLISFEKSLQNASSPKDVINGYRASYAQAINAYGVDSARALRKKKDILAFAGAVSPVVDSYYLDGRINCVNYLYHWESAHSRRILQYNLGALYDQVPNRHSRILAAYPNDTQLGVYSGFFVNNQSTTLETQFMTGMPLLTALYVMPKYDYADAGGEFTMVPWGYFNTDSFLDPVTRKVLDVGGIDVFSVLRSQMATKKISEFPGAKPLDSKIMPMFGGDYQPYINTQSYGMAYLANQVFVENDADISRYESIIKDYFSKPTTHDPKLFVETTNILYQKLLNLPAKHDILLETRRRDFTQSDQPAGTVVIKGIVGERALFQADCLRENCTFVLNVSNAPGWHAIVNGRFSPIERANYAFMATKIPNGVSTVWFIYAPYWTVISYFISMILLISIPLLSMRRISR